MADVIDTLRQLSTKRCGIVKTFLFDKEIGKGVIMHTKETNLISLSDDILFKDTLSHPDNRKYLIYFLACFLNLDYDYLAHTNIKVINELNLPKTKIKDKAYRGDIVVFFDNYVVNIECYSTFRNSAFNKSTNYLMRLFSTQFSMGNNNYTNLKNIISLNFVDNVKLKMPPKYEITYGLVNFEDLSDKRLEDKFLMKYFRLDKAKNVSYNLDNKKIRWLKFIKAKSYEERKEVAKGDDTLMELNNWIEKYINDEHTKEIYGKWAEEIAKENGYEQGSNQKSIDIAKQMLKDTIAIPTIAKYTGLSIKQIKALR